MNIHKAAQVTIHNLHAEYARTFERIAVHALGYAMVAHRYNMPRIARIAMAIGLLALVQAMRPTNARVAMIPSPNDNTAINELRRYWSKRQ